MRDERARITHTLGAAGSTGPAAHVELGALRHALLPETSERLRGRLVVASLSGGKDSTALALFLRELQIPHVRVFADTGFESPGTYAYLEQLRARLGPIDVVRNESLWHDARPGEEGMLTLIRRKQMFPSRLMRFCTQHLKLRPIRDYVRALQERGDEVVNAVGVRAEESAARARMAEWEFWDDMDVEIWRPLLAWSEQDVIDMHRRHGVAPNPLYLQGARRVGCYPCIHARKKDLRLLPAAQIAKIRRVEEDLTTDATARQCERPTRAFFQIRGEGGRLHFAPIDEVVRLAHQHRGQPIEADAEPAGCARWGLCEASPAPTPEAAPARRVIGYEHLVRLGATPAMIRVWLERGVVRETEDAGFFERTPALDERLAARRIVGRGHLLALGLTAAGIARSSKRQTSEVSTASRRSPSRACGLREARRQSSKAPPRLPRRASLRRRVTRMHPVASRRRRSTVAALKADSAEQHPSQDPGSVHEPSARIPATAEPGLAAGENLRVVPCTLRRARAFCAAHHRHHGAPVGGLFALGIARGDELVGVAVVGRPVARALQDGTTAEVTRVCTLGAPNGCSKLLAACRRVAHHLGYRRLVTYTLSEEPGTSLRAAGWIETARVPGRSWSRRTRPRTTPSLGDKRRWEAPLSRAKETLHVHD